MVKPGSKNKPTLSLPPCAPRAVASVADKLAGLGAAESWIQQPAVADALGAGVHIAQTPDAPTEGPKPGVEAVEGGGEPEVISLTFAKPMKALLPPHGDENREVKVLLRLDGKTNARIERLLDRIPRSSKNRLLMLAIGQFLERVEKQLDRADQQRPQ